MESKSVALGQVHCPEDVRLTNGREGLSEGRNEVPLAQGVSVGVSALGGCWRRGDVAGERMK